MVLIPDLSFGLKKKTFIQELCLMMCSAKYLPSYAQFFCSEYVRVCIHIYTHIYVYRNQVN